MNDQIRVRVNRGNPGHHLWLNNGTWFIHYTVHRADYTKVRIRTSLGTKSIDLARRLRDRVLRGQLMLANGGAGQCLAAAGGAQ